MASSIDCSMCFEAHSRDCPLQALNPCGHLVHRDCFSKWHDQQLISRRSQGYLSVKCHECRQSLTSPYLANVWITPLVDSVIEAGKLKSDYIRLTIELQEATAVANKARTVLARWKKRAKTAASSREFWKNRNARVLQQLMDTQASVAVLESMVSNMRSILLDHDTNASLLSRTHGAATSNFSNVQQKLQSREVMPQNFLPCHEASLVASDKSNNLTRKQPFSVDSNDSRATAKRRKLCRGSIPTLGMEQQEMPTRGVDDMSGEAITPGSASVQRGAEGTERNPIDLTLSSP